MNCDALKSFFSSAVIYLRRAHGWKRLGLAFAIGSAMALTMPPFNLFPLLWVCFPAAIFLLQGTTSKRQAFAVGWSFAFGFLVFGLYWIAVSMFVDLAHFWWAVPLAVAGLPACFAIYYGIAAVVARQIDLSGLSGAIVFGLMWFVADYARGHLFTGFPWNLIGYAWSGVLPVLQITSVIGIYGLTLLTVIAACLPAGVLDEHAKAPRVAFAASLILFAALAIGGEMRLQGVSVGTVPDVRLRLVQPNIAQTMKWDPREREKNLQTLLELSSAESPVRPTHIFWPETASTYYLSEDADHRQEIADHIPSSATLITGVIRRQFDETGTMHFYNSMVAVDGLGRLVAGYDKAHLVPFGEFMPMRKFLPNAMKALAASEADFSAGPGPRSIRVLGLPLFSPLICYEAIFPGSVVARDDRPDFMVNLTNDGWYGNTTGPYQHFAIARIRAIEEGLPLIRVANTGISGVIDPLGRVENSLALGNQGFIDSDLPQPLPPTLFSKYEVVPLLSGFLTFCLIAFILIFLKRK